MITCPGSRYRRGPPVRRDGVRRWRPWGGHRRDGGSGRFRQRPLPWLPFANTIWLRPGVDRVSDMFVRIGPITVMKVLDAYVDGRGITKFLSRADTGPRVDQGAMHPMLCESLMFPSCWSRTPGFAWEPVDADTARVHMPFGAGFEVASVGFDPDTGFPATFETMRFKGKDGPRFAGGSRCSGGDGSEGRSPSAWWSAGPTSPARGSGCGSSGSPSGSTSTNL